MVVTDIGRLMPLERGHAGTGNDPRAEAHAGTQDGARRRGRQSRRLGPLWAEIPGLARVAASLGWHTTTWGVRTTARHWRRVARATADAEEAAALVRDVTRSLDVVGDLARAVSAGTPAPAALLQASSSLGGLTGPDVVSGRIVGQYAEPLAEEAEPSADERAREETLHPVYAAVLDALSPDEAQILATLQLEGPQPSVDVRTSRLGGLRRSRVIASGLTLFAARAELAEPDRVPAYLASLRRQGLVWITEGPLDDLLPYRTLEAQLDVLLAVRAARFATIDRRGVRLTPFGREFTLTCLVGDEPEDPAAR